MQTIFRLCDGGASVTPNAGFHGKELHRRVRGVRISPAVDNRDDRGTRQALLARSRDAGLRQILFAESVRGAKFEATEVAAHGGRTIDATL